MAFAVAAAAAVMPAVGRGEGNPRRSGGDQGFEYKRAAPEVRWPSARPAQSEDAQLPLSTTENAGGFSQILPLLNLKGGDVKEAQRRGAPGVLRVQKGEGERRDRELPLRMSTRRLSKLALKKAKDWKSRVQRFATAICELDLDTPVADAVEGWSEQLSPNDLCCVLNSVGQTDWRRSLELYEWLNLRDWYTPNPRMLASILGVLGRSGQVTLARELFNRAEPELRMCVQVYNALLSVHARHGQWQEVQHVLTLMQRKGCEPDLITFNTIANARSKGGLQPGMATSLLQEIYRAGLRPDAITYNTLLSGCIAKQNFAEAREIVLEMKRRGCAPDIWTHRAIYAASGSAGWDGVENAVFKSSDINGSTLDVVTDNPPKLPFGNDKRVCSADDTSKQTEASNHSFDGVGCASVKHMHSNERNYNGPNLFDQVSGEAITPDSVTYTATADLPEKSELYKGQQVYKGKLEANVEHALCTSQTNLCRSDRETSYWQAEGVLMDSHNQPLLVIGDDVVLKTGDFGEAASFHTRTVETGMETSLPVQEAELSLCKEQANLTELLHLSHFLLQPRNLGLWAMVCSRFMAKLLLSDSILEKIFYLKIKNTLSQFAMMTNPSKDLQAGNLLQMITPFDLLPEVGPNPRDASNSRLISLYFQIKRYWKFSKPFQDIQAIGCEPEIVRRSKLIGLGTEEMVALLCEMRHAGWLVDASHYGFSTMPTSRLPLLEAPVACLQHMEEAGCNLRNCFNNNLTNLYRRTVNYREAGAQMSLAASTAVNGHVHYNSLQKRGDLAKVESYKSSRPGGQSAAGAVVYTRLMNAYFNDEDYSSGVEKLMDMIDAGLEPNYSTWTCVLQACSRCRKRSDLLMLLSSLGDAGCPLPLRLLMGNEAVMLDVESWLTKLQAATADGGQIMVNALGDVLWAFKRRATAGRLFDLAVRLGVYPESFSRVQNKDWEADLRNLSPGTALVALTNWLIQMQEASLEGFVESPKEVLLITGTRIDRNRTSLNKTLRAHLWEMGAPFFVRRARQGALIAKGHSLRLWLKDSPRCVSMELEDSPELPKLNSMEVYNGAWMSADAVPAVEQIQASMGGEVLLRRYSKLAQLSDEERTQAIAAHVEHKKVKKQVWSSDRRRK